ncbi:glycerophosphodiester phosphodiesterase [Natronoglycomyces albus]|uniref:glycerophosphodiester phosphodiesterase n=1 Tax=Natronoglycomyces albus TaxID=2811108 RepID=UPI0031B6241E
MLAGATPLAFAHRGWSDSQDENSLAAFQRAVDAGCWFMETDVHVTADGVPVLFHDKTLERMTGDQRPICEFTWAQLRTITIAGNPLVPSLAQALNSWDDVRWNLDLKVDAAVDITLETIRRSNAFDRVLVASFSDWRLHRARRLAGPRLATSMGLGEVARLWMASRGRTGWWGFVRNVPAVQVPARSGAVRVVTPRFVDWAHRLGIQVHVWTINDPDTMRSLLDMGVDGIMTDDLAALTHVYHERGHWPVPLHPPKTPDSS